MYTTVLFDFDGTLTNSLELWVQTFHYAFGKFSQVHPEEVVIARCFYRPLNEITTEFNVPLNEFRRHFQEGLWMAFENPALFPGVFELLQTCFEGGLKIGLVTSSSRSVVERALVSMEIDTFFNALVTADDIINFKPHPEPVQKALTLLDAAPGQTIFVGDSTADILAGHAAGTDTALFYPPVHYKFYEFDTLNATSPHFVFGDYSELSSHLFGSANQV